MVIVEVVVLVVVVMVVVIMVDVVVMMVVMVMAATAYRTTLPLSTGDCIIMNFACIVSSNPITSNVR